MLKLGYRSARIMVTSVPGDNSLARRPALIPASLPPMTTNLFLIMISFLKTTEHNIHIDIIEDCIMVFRIFLMPPVKTPRKKAEKLS